MDLENAVLQRGLDPLRVEALWQRQSAGEATSPSLTAVVIIALGLPVLRPLAADRQHAVVNAHVDVLLAEPRNIHSHDDLVLTVYHVHGRRPSTGLPGEPGPGPIANESVEEILDSRGEVAQRTAPSEASLRSPKCERHFAFTSSSVASLASLSIHIANAVARCRLDTTYSGAT